MQRSKKQKKNINIQSIYHAHSKNYIVYLTKFINTTKQVSSLKQIKWGDSFRLNEMKKQNVTIYTVQKGIKCCWPLSFPLKESHYKWTCGKTLRTTHNMAPSLIPQLPPVSPLSSPIQLGFPTFINFFTLLDTGSPSLALWWITKKFLIYSFCPTCFCSTFISILWLGVMLSWNMNHHRFSKIQILGVIQKCHYEVHHFYLSLSLK